MDNQHICFFDHSISRTNYIVVSEAIAVIYKIEITEELYKLENKLQNYKK